MRDRERRRENNGERMKENLLCGFFFFLDIWIASLTRVLRLFKKWRKQEGIEWEVSLSLENKLDFSNTLDIVIHKQHYRTIKAYFKYTRF